MDYNKIEKLILQKYPEKELRKVYPYGITKEILLLVYNEGFKDGKTKKNKVSKYK